jgi:hypothetical protein
MARYLGKTRSREALRSLVGDAAQVAGARSVVLADGKADGVRAVEVYTGGGFACTVLPGRGMDIPFASYKGASLSFHSGTGITHPGYYEEPGDGWLRAFFGGLLTTCGIANAGAPSTDQGRPFGLHGRFSNAAAEDLCVRQDWEGDEYLIRISGRLREASAMGEHLVLTRTIETRLGARGFRLHDIVENRGFEEQPLMLLYHFNCGFPLLAPGARIVAPIRSTTPRSEEARKDRGVEECREIGEPIPGYREKVFFHDLAHDAQGRTLVALVNRDVGNGEPLAIVERFSVRELPAFTEWKMMRKGFYVLGLEPGTVTPLGRGVLRDQGKLPMLAGQQTYSVTIDVEVLDTAEEIAALEREAAALASSMDGRRSAPTT